MVLVASLAFLSISIQPADAAFDMFIKIGDIKGESTDKDHKDEIDFLAWNWGLSNTVTDVGGGGAGKANLQDFSFIKFTDLSTTDLMKSTLDGKHIKDATITIRKSGDKPVDFLKYVLKDVIVTSVSTGGSVGEDRPTESVTLNFGKIETHYIKQNQDGKCTEVSFGWDVTKNVKFDPPGLGLCSSLPPADTDGDSIPDIIDTDDANPSNDFNDNGAPIPTAGTIISRGDQTLSFTDLPNPQGVQVSATGGVSPAVISWCDGLHASLASGSTVNLTCGSSIIQVVLGSADVSFTDDENNSIDSTLLVNQDFEFDATTFTLSSNAGTSIVTLTTDDGKIITITIPEGNDLTIDVDTLIFTAPETNNSPVILEQDGEETPLDPNSQIDLDQKFVEPQLRNHLTKKMTDYFKKQIKFWELRIHIHEKIIPLLESQADKAESKGNLVKAQQLRDRVADKQDKIEILEDLISVLQVSLGLSPPQKIPVDSQDNLLPRSVDGIEKRISVWDSKVVKLNKRADDLETKANKYDVQAQEKLLQGKTKQANDLEKKADNLRAEAESLRDKALVYSDLSQVLKISIDMEAESTIVSVDEENDKDETDTMFQ